MKDKILKKFDEEYLEKIDKYNPLKEDLIKLFTDQKQFLIKAIYQTREETIKEIIGMCVNFDDYNNDQIISKEMLEELLNKLKK